MKILKNMKMNYPDAGAYRAPGSRTPYFLFVPRTVLQFFHENISYEFDIASGTPYITANEIISCRRKIRMPARVSLKEIAATVGLSVASVSEILNNRPNNYSSEATKERVRRAAKEMGYQVSFGYKLLRRQKTRTVAIMNSRAQMNDEEHVMALTLRLTTGFDKLGYAAYYNAFSDDAEANLKKVRELIGRGVESFVFLGQPFGQQEIMAELEASGINSVGIATTFPRWVKSCLFIGGEALIRYFRSRIGDNFRLICEKKQCNPCCHGFGALMRAYPELSEREIRKRFIYPMEDIDFYVPDPHASWECHGFKTTGLLLHDFPNIEGIIYMNDSFAVGGGNCLLQSGYRKYRSLLLGGFNNDQVIRNYPLPICSVQHNLSRLAAELVREALLSTPCGRLLSPELHIRIPTGKRGYPYWTEHMEDALKAIHRLSPGSRSENNTVLHHIKKGNRNEKKPNR